jgi:hypothetical protein
MSTTQPLSVLAPNSSKVATVRETPMTKTFVFDSMNKQNDSGSATNVLFVETDTKNASIPTGSFCGKPLYMDAPQSSKTLVMEKPATMHMEAHHEKDHQLVFVHMDRKEGCHKPACHSPCAHKPACAKPCEQKPACPKPCEQKPACPKPCEQKPACPKPCEQKPACPKPCEQKPACPKPCEQKPACPRPCEQKPACPKPCPKPCDSKPVCPLRGCDVKPACETGCKNECCVTNYNNGWTWFGWIILWFIIFTILFWLIYYSLRPSFVLDTESNEVDTGKVLLASVVSALILVVGICIIKALLKSYCY